MARLETVQSIHLLELDSVHARFRLGAAGTWIELKRRPTLWRLLLALAEGDEEAGRTLPASRLIEAGWPGELILPEAARNRLHVAIATLRRLGLRSVLQTTSAGYGLTGGLQIVRTSTAGRPLDAAPAIAGGSSLPGLDTSLVGRAEEVEQVVSWLSADSGLGGLVGLGGIGKTRVALEAGHRLAEQLPGGVLHANLSQIREREEVCLALLPTLGPGPGPRADPAAITTALAGRGPALLILDNAETARACLGELVGRWQAGAPQLRVLITSRIPIRIPRIRNLALGPLGPADALALFVARAALDRPQFEPEREAKLPELLELLDGHPLALELAAERSATRPISSLVEALAARPGEPGTALEAALNWSWQALEAAEQQTLASLAYFRGGFTLGAAEAVDARTSAQPWIGEIVHRLCELGLVEAEGARFWLTEIVGRFARARLAEQPELLRSVREAHAHHFGSLEVLARIGETFDALSPDDFDRLMEEQSNLRLAAEAGITAGRAEWALPAALALAELYHQIGPLPLAHRLLRSALALEPAEATQKARARLRLVWLERSQASAEAHPLMKETLRAAREIGDPALLGDAELTAAILRLERGELAVASERLEVILEHASRHELGTLEAAALNLKCIIARTQGDAASARTLGQRALEVARGLGNDRRIGSALSNLATAELLLGHTDEAERNLEEALATFTRARDRGTLPLVVSNLALIALTRGDLASARDHFRRAGALHRSLGQVRGTLSTQGNLGLVELAAGNLEVARTLLEAAMGAAKRAGLKREMSGFCAGLGEALARLGDPDGARRAFDRTRRALRGTGDRALLVCLHAHRGLAAAAAGDEKAARRYLGRARSEAEDEQLRIPAEVSYLLGRLEKALG